MSFVNIFVFLFLSALGAIIKYGKASWLIAGYNTASEKEKAKYDEKALCSFVGNLLFVLGGINLVIGIIGFISTALFFYVQTGGWVLFTLVIIAAVVYMNTGNRFLKK